MEKRVAAEKVHCNALGSLAHFGWNQPEGLILVNNAGVLKKDWSEADFNETIAANVIVYTLLRVHCQSCLPAA